MLCCFRHVSVEDELRQNESSGKAADDGSGLWNSDHQWCAALFCQRCKKGKIGVVGASGTGTQKLPSGSKQRRTLLVIGTGGVIHDQIGGLMMIRAEH